MVTKIDQMVTKNRPNGSKIDQMAVNRPNGSKIDQPAIKYTNIFHCKTLQNLPKSGFLVRKYTIWQPGEVSGEDFFQLNFDKKKSHD
jgi:hypothetical protein